MEKRNVMYVSQRVGGLHITVSGQFTHQVAAELYRTVGTMYQGNGNIFIHTKEITDVQPGAQQLLEDLFSQNSSLQQYLYLMGEKGFLISTHSAKVLVQKKKKGGCCGKCANCHCLKNDTPKGQCYANSSR